MTDINFLLDKYTNGEITRDELEADLVVIGYSERVKNILLGIADKEKAIFNKERASCQDNTQATEGKRKNIFPA